MKGVKFQPFTFLISYAKLLMFGKLFYMVFIWGGVGCKYYWMLNKIFKWTQSVGENSYHYHSCLHVETRIKVPEDLIVKIVSISYKRTFLALASNFVIFIF